MDRNEQTLSLIGLCLRGRNLEVGEEPVEAVARARDARVLLLAADAAEGTRRRCEHFAQAGDCLWLQLPFTKAELGRALGRTAVAITAVTDVGLAAALLHRLAEILLMGRLLRPGKRRRKAPPAPKAAKPPAEMPPERAPDGNRPRGAKPYRSRPPRDARPKPKAQARPYANSRPVKKGKGSFRKKKEG